MIMKNLILSVVLIFATSFMFAQSNNSVVNETGDDNISSVIQDGLTNQSDVDQHLKHY